MFVPPAALRGRSAGPYAGSARGRLPLDPQSARLWVNCCVLGVLSHWNFTKLADGIWLFVSFLVYFENIVKWVLTKTKKCGIMKRFKWRQSMEDVNWNMVQLIASTSAAIPAVAVNAISPDHRFPTLLASAISPNDKLLTLPTYALSPDDERLTFPTYAISSTYSHPGIFTSAISPGDQRHTPFHPALSPTNGNCKAMKAFRGIWKVNGRTHKANLIKKQHRPVTVEATGILKHRLPIINMGLGKTFGRPRDLVPLKRSA